MERRACCSAGTVTEAGPSFSGPAARVAGTGSWGGGGSRGVGASRRRDVPWAWARRAGHRGAGRRDGLTPGLALPLWASGGPRRCCGSARAPGGTCLSGSGASRGAARWCCWPHGTSGTPGSRCCPPRPTGRRPGAPSRRSSASSTGRKRTSRCAWRLEGSPSGEGERDPRGGQAPHSCSRAGAAPAGAGHPAPTPTALSRLSPPKRTLAPEGGKRQGSGERREGGRTAGTGALAGTTTCPVTHHGGLGGGSFPGRLPGRRACLPPPAC